MSLAFILFPLAMAALAASAPLGRRRPLLLPFTGLVHAAMTVAVLLRPDLGEGVRWLVLDAPGRLVLLLVSILFLLISWFSVGYLAYRAERPNRVFCACLSAFLGFMSLVIWAHHLGLMWVGIEATTLATAPLIYFNSNQRSLEATWKYLLVGSVGIALALLGTFFLAYAAIQQGLASSLTFEDLLIQAPRLSKPWLHAAFILMLVGYGTKMGLAPMHTWKPDAYGEAPGIVGALLAGGATNCAFLALLRIYDICRAAGEGAYCSRLLIIMGLFSMAVAGAFMIGQRDFKRMLAYSSVEHMGILVLGLGIGGAALFGTMLHIVSNGLTKGVLFLAAGNIHRAFGSKNTDVVRGALRRVPVSGSLFLIGFLAVTGSPPFAPFVSEFSIVVGIFETGRYFSATLFLVFLLVVFFGMGATVLRAVQGEVPPGTAETGYRDRFLTTAPIAVFALLVLVLGLYLPPPLAAMIDDAVRFLEGRA